MKKVSAFPTGKHLGIVDATAAAAADGMLSMSAGTGNKSVGRRAIAYLAQASDTKRYMMGNSSTDSHSVVSSASYTSKQCAVWSRSE